MSLQVNHVVQVEFTGHAGSKRVGCVVTAVTADRVILRVLDVTAPPPGAEIGATIALSLVNEQGVHSATAQIAQVASKPHVALALRAPIKLVTKQNRRFVRVTVKLPVRCAVRASAKAELVGSTDTDAKTLDLSAGGMRLATTLPLSVGDELDLTVSLQSGVRSQTREIQRAGRVLRVLPGETKPRVTIFAGIELIHANQREQDALVMIVFELERKRLV